MLLELQDPQVGLCEDKIIDAIERPHQERLQNTTVGVVLIFHCWINEVGVGENGSTTSSQIYRLGKTFNLSRLSPGAPDGMGALPGVSTASLASKASDGLTASLVSTVSPDILSASPCDLTKEPDGIGALPGVSTASLLQKLLAFRQLLLFRQLRQTFWQLHQQ